VLADARMAMQDVDSNAKAFESYQEPVLDIGAPADYMDPADFAHMIMTVEWVESDNYQASLRPPYNDKFMVTIEVNGVKRGRWIGQEWGRGTADLSGFDQRVITRAVRGGRCHAHA
jgi:hypothetical protein